MEVTLTNVAATTELIGQLLSVVQLNRALGGGWQVAPGQTARHP
jgi:hypothetical protein